MSGVLDEAKPALGIARSLSGQTWRWRDGGGDESLQPDDLVTRILLARGAPRLDRFSAACANGMAITWCELDEGFRNASCHAGAYTLPALLAAK